jgi:hypothetical protein
MFINFKTDINYEKMTEGVINLNNVESELLELIMGDSVVEPSQEILKFKKFLYEDCTF